jgi:hypothetical protein
VRPADAPGRADRGVALAGWIAQTVQVHHGDGSFEGRCGQAQRVGDAWTTEYGHRSCSMYRP